MDFHDKPPSIEPTGRVGEFRVSCNSVLDADTNPHTCSFVAIVDGHKAAEEAAGTHALSHLSLRKRRGT